MFLFIKLVQTTKLLDETKMQGPLDVKNENKPKPERREKEKIHISSNGGKDDEFSDSLETRKKYKDVADAAQAAFESAAYAAAAARAAVELSRSESHDPPPPDDDNTLDDGGSNSREENMSQVVDKEIVEENQGEEFSKSDNEEDAKEAAVSVVAEVDAHPLKEEPVFDESENEADSEHEGKQSLKQISSKSHDGIVAGSDLKDPILKTDTGFKNNNPQSVNLEKLKKPFSVRTKRVLGF